MAPVEKRLLSEIVALHKLEPTLKGVYVEGKTDHALINFVLRKNNQSDTLLCSADWIEVPSPAQDNNRRKILLVARELELQIPSGNCRAVCLVDRDFDDWLGPLPSGKYLLLTDYHSIEVYLFSRRVLEHYFAVALGEAVNLDVVYPQFCSILKALFGLRVANEMLRLGLHMPIRIEKYLKVRRDSIVLDYDQLSKSYAASNSHIQASLTQKAAEISAAFCHQAVQYICGHDLILLLHHYSKELKGRRYSFSDELGCLQCLCACVHASDLDEFPAIKALLAR